jgi:hypothetical protein
MLAGEQRSLATISGNIHSAGFGTAVSKPEFNPGAAFVRIYITDPGASTQTTSFGVSRESN